MTKNNSVLTNIVFLFLFGIATIQTVNAQKLPNKQETSVWTPTNIEIDGKAIEWSDRYQAYNHATDVFYTLANSASNIYLLVHATNADVINKIYKTGLSFTISMTGNKSDEGAVNIVYPIFDVGDRFHVNIRSMPTLIAGNAASKLQIDSFMNASNNLLQAKAKWIGVTGIQGIDTLISVYNEDGIKAASLFDNLMGYTIEISVPLKYLHFVNKKNIGFAYHIKLNALNPMQSDNITKTTTIRPKDGGTVTQINLGTTMDLNQLIRSGKTLNATTNFSGEYTLATKP